MKNIGVILSILALFTAVMGLALAMAAFFRRRGFSCCDDDLEDYDYEDDDCCCDEGPIPIHDTKPAGQEAEAPAADAGTEDEDLSF